LVKTNTHPNNIKGLFFVVFVLKGYLQAKLYESVKVL